MTTITSQDLIVLKRHYRALCHLRERKTAERIAIFLGAGASKQFGFPNWEELITRIETQPEFDGYKKPAGKHTLTYRTQALISYLMRGETIKAGHIDAAEERVARHQWITTVHRCLYEKTVSDSELSNHPYLNEFLGTIKESPLTINYNFDDCIERMLAKNYEHEQNNKNERVYETVWDPSTQYQKSKGVIYHPNGFLPKKLINGHSDNIVFTEGEFADQLIQSTHGHYSTLVSHLSRYTALMIGLSLEDPTLKHLLRQNTHYNPGHVHYLLKHCDCLPQEESIREEQDVNFEVYGIITLHLTESEFSSFGRLLSCCEATFAEAADRLGCPTKQTYYITGAVGAGKSSTVHKLKSLYWIGEWIDHKPEHLAKPHTDLSEDERASVDMWVSLQFRKKNFKIHAVRYGLIICDRSPIDPLAFAREDDRQARANTHIGTMVPNHNSMQLTKGHVIFLTASGDELLSRSKHRHKNATKEYLEKQQDIIRELYCTPNDSVTEISTCGRTLSQVVRIVAKCIHLGEYTEFDIHKRITELSNGDVL